MARSPRAAAPRRSGTAAAAHLDELVGDRPGGSAAYSRAIADSMRMPLRPWSTMIVVISWRASSANARPP